MSEAWLANGWLAPQGFENDLKLELYRAGIKNFQKHGRLFYSEEAADKPTYWVDNIWCDCKIVKIASISDAAKILRAAGRNWAAYSENLFRRTALICDQLPKQKIEPLVFSSVPQSPIKYGCFTLLGQDLMLYSANCSSPFIGGAISFVENKIDPPSRAYLKLWEAFVRLGRYPTAHSRCLDVGASPGGWAWVLQRLGAQVTAIDRAPLADNIAYLKGITTLKHNAFSMRPEDLGKFDWLVSDVICAPEKLYEWISLWLESGLVENFICTLKMQGKPDFETIDKFAAIPGSKIVHLYHNKHELTWMLVKNKEPMGTTPAV